MWKATTYGNEEHCCGIHLGCGITNGYGDVWILPSAQFPLQIVMSHPITHRQLPSIQCLSLNPPPNWFFDCTHRFYVFIYLLQLSHCPYHGCDMGSYMIKIKTKSLKKPIKKPININQTIGDRYWKPYISTQPLCAPPLFLWDPLVCW